MENDKNYDEHLCDLRDELVAQRIQEKRYLNNESIKVFIENIDDNKYQYIFRNLVFNDDKDDLLKYLLNSEYYIDVVYSVLGIEKGNYKAYINDFDHITNTSEVEFKDLQYISKINDEYEFYEEEPNKQKLEDLLKIDINTKASYLSNKVVLNFDFCNDYEGNCKYYFSEINFWNIKVCIVCNIYGLPTKEYMKRHNMNITTWMEELIHSVCLYEAKDFRLAIATAVSALDRFISDEFKYINKYYHSIDLTECEENKRNAVAKRTEILDNYITNNRSYLYKKLPEIMKDYNFLGNDTNFWQGILKEWNNLRNIVDHALDGEIVNNNVTRRYSDEFEKGYKTLLYLILKFINLIESHSNIDDEIICLIDLE